MSILMVVEGDVMPGEPANRANGRPLEVDAGSIGASAPRAHITGLPDEDAIQAAAGTAYAFIRHGTVTREGYEAVRYYMECQGYDVDHDELLTKMRMAVIGNELTSMVLDD